MKKLHPILAAVSALVIVSLACSGGDSPDVLPPTVAPDITEATPVPTPEGGGVVSEGEFFDLDLTRSDQDALENLADSVYQKIIDAGGDVDRRALLDAYQELTQVEPVGGAWRAVGPAPIEGIYMPQGRLNSAGRVNQFAIDPRDTNVVYAASSFGGLWKTTNGGQDWRSLSEKDVPAIYGGVELDPNNPDHIYARLGEFDGITASTYGYLANGVLKSEDGGETWALFGAEEFNGAAVTGLVFGDGVIYASSGQTGVYEAPADQPDFGVFRSNDGGESWERLVSCADFADCVPNPASGITAFLGGFFDLDIGSDGTLFASLCNVECFGNKLLRSTDGGDSWDEIDFSNVLEDWSSENGVDVQYLDDAGTIPYLEGLEVAVAPSNPAYVLAGGGIYWLGENDDGDQIEGVWSFAMLSTDGGDSWAWLPEAGDYCTGGGSSSQCSYDNAVEFDPTDENVMYLGGSFSQDDDGNWVAMVRRSADGGESWSDSTPPADGSFIHPDVHGISIDPSNPERVWVGCDGGVYLTEDVSSDEPAWEPMNSGMNTLLIVDIGLHPEDPNYIIAGLQDNGNAFTTDLSNWEGASQGDSGTSAVDPFDGDIVYSHYPQYFFSRNENGGEGGMDEWFGSFGEGYIDGLDGSDNWLFYPPFTLDPNTEGVIYFGSNQVYKTEDRGDSWFSISDYLNQTDDGTIRSIAVAPGDPNVIYVGLTEGTAYVTFDGGEEWNDITGADFPTRNVTRIAVDPNDSNIAYATFSGFGRETPDRPGLVFRTTDGGQSWEDLTLNLPDAPLHAVVVDVRPDYAGVYVGGALGVWVLQEGSDEWHPYGTAMPYSIVSDLELNPNTGIMAAATYGRSVWIIEMP